MEALKSKKRRGVGIKWKMFAILAAFIAVTLVVIWFFQVRMLNYFYLTTKFSELEDSLERIEDTLDGDREELKATVFDCSLEYNSAICVLRMESSDRAKMLVETNGPVGTLLPIMSDADIVNLCNMAMSNGGRYVATVSTGDGSGYQKSEIFGGDSEESVIDAVKKAKRGAVAVVLVEYVRQDGSEYYIVQTSDLTPVGATVRTLERQFLWIGIILLGLALVLALIMSKVITRPIIKINKAAKELPSGCYGSNLKITGYREIRELSDTLALASEEISRSDKLQKELISNVSHDLRTPLTLIKGYSEVMRDIPDENTPENIQVIIDESARLSELVGDMLDISKLRAGTRAPEMSEFSLTDTVRAVLARYEKLVTKDGYKIEFFENSNVSVVADRSMILQVVYNLINNAVNYTGEDKRVTVTQTVSDGKVRISVRDTGEGIDKENIELIWDRYYKVDKVHKRAAVGTGLGLSIVKGILELHRATYGVESTLGVGTCFWFELDARAAE